MTANRTVFGCAVSVALCASGAVAIAAAPAPTLQEALQQRIADNMTMPVMMGGQEMIGGIARVVFTVGTDGRTHDVKIGKRSGSASVDRAAILLISSFRGLPPSLDGKPIQAVLQYRTSGEEGDTAPQTALASQVALARADALVPVLVADALPAATASRSSVVPPRIASR